MMLNTSGAFSDESDVLICGFKMNQVSITAKVDFNETDRMNFMKVYDRNKCAITLLFIIIINELLSLFLSFSLSFHIGPVCIQNLVKNKALLLCLQYKTCLVTTCI